ncbi:hypothetical protein BT96DRAFT_1051716 [Gymnopus androsaceus JB14]|uniref:Uncharacterized protein n=1 Tax=Gymnopus androsaceus JB14 TaxID=1447944 RepID=A0A6A4H7N6_9AGAR|nr:hypothetical protein BT96DRAFT_1051716 [Gymnopus androsaceus JB14]
MLLNRSRKARHFMPHMTLLELRMNNPWNQSNVMIKNLPILKALKWSTEDGAATKLQLLRIGVCGEWRYYWTGGRLTPSRPLGYEASIGGGKTVSRVRQGSEEPKNREKQATAETKKIQNDVVCGMASPLATMTTNVVVPALTNSEKWTHAVRKQTLCMASCGMNMSLWGVVSAMQIHRVQMLTMKRPRRSVKQLLIEAQAGGSKERSSCCQPKSLVEIPSAQRGGVERDDLLLLAVGNKALENWFGKPWIQAQLMKVGKTQQAERIEGGKGESQQTTKDGF